MKVDIFNTDKKYDIIYADPPWRYEVWSRDTGLGRSAESHYKTMKKEEIERLPIRFLSKKNSVLFLWATAPCMTQAIDLIKKWGFTYKTVAFTWIKQNKKSDSLFWGMGYYTRSNAEYCLLATKGKILERISKSVHSVIECDIISKIQEHSKKPDETRDKIIKLFGDIPRVELFARQYADGWDCWGNEV